MSFVVVVRGRACRVRRFQRYQHCCQHCEQTLSQGARPFSNPWYNVLCRPCFLANVSVTQVLVAQS